MGEGGEEGEGILAGLSLSLQGVVSECFLVCEMKSTDM